MTDPARQATTNARIPLRSMPVAGAMTPGFRSVAEIRLGFAPQSGWLAP